MTTATVVAQQSENFGRFAAASCSSAGTTASTVAAPGTQLRMNDTHQPQPLHTSDTSPRDQNTNGTSTGGGLAVANLALHGGASGALNANSNGSTTSNGSGTNTTNNNNHGTGKSRTMSLSEGKIDHLLRDQQREQQREQHQSSHHQQSSQQQQQHHQHPLQNRLRAVSPTPSEQQYALKWNDFQSSILSSFRHLRDEEDFVDVTIACDSRSFTAHKVVLSACSPYFRKLLKANPCEHPIVILRDVRSEDIENLLRFMYNGEVHIGQDQLSDFLKTAQLLQVRGLADVTTGNPTGGRTSANSSMLNSSLSTPAVQELKASPTSTSLPWELPDDNNPAPPPQKRTKSSELYRKQHGLSPDDPIPLDLLPIGQHPLTRERDRSKDKSKQDHHHRGSSEHDLHHHHHHRERDRSLELRESLLGQALEGGPTLTVPSKHPDLLSLQAVASGEDSNSSDTAASDHGDDIEGLNGNIEHTRPSFPFLGLQGIPGLIPGPSGMHGDNFDARQHCDALIKEEIDEPQRNDASHRAAIHEDRATGRVRRRDHDQNGLDCSTGSRQHQQLQQRRFAKRFKRSHHPEVGENLHRRHTVASPSVSLRSEEAYEEQTMERGHSSQRPGINGPSVLDDVREALALRRSTANHTEVPARQKPTYNSDVEEEDEEDVGNGERGRVAVANRDTNDRDIRTPLRDEDEDDEEDADGGSEDNELDLKVDGRLSAIATTLDSEYHKRMAAAGVLAAAAAASASALGDAGSEQAAADFFAAHHKAGTHELALKQHFLNEKVRLQALLQRQAQQHQHHQKLAGFLLSTATTPPTPTLTPTNVLNLGQSGNTDHQRGGSASPATTAGGRSSAAAGNGDSGSCSKPANSKQQSSCNSSPSPASSAAAVAAAAAAADRLFAAAYSNSASAAAGAGTGAGGSSAGGANVGSGSAGNGQVYLLPCPLCEVPLEPRVFRQHLDRHYPRDSPVCPVIQCGRRFAHPNSVRNHMRLKHTNQWAQMKAMRSSGGPFTGIP
ncbi:broad-complex core protein isoforms 1/2/3/4/5-like isoform X2 [Anopheles marshallii]|uniref:broad-complex core protein isoforms 1/2/3/4/5-like isoform X2 n=1 Tax=Anopheles marshallii TaxID=1521116 RepID=UPI00237AD81F|nr:broad-complex core protein isoforms 1/2/3/4/5-like isoform X2 [Anopheles marshallii]